MDDVKIKLVALWVAHMLSTTYADVLRLYDPKEVVASFPMTHEVMLVSAITMVIPIVMVPLSLMLKDKVNRWVNIIVGIFWVGYDLLMVFSTLNTGAPTYEIFLGFVYLVFAIPIVWYAYKWK
jgi:glucose uptake protein GlcU